MRCLVEYEKDIRSWQHYHRTYREFIQTHDFCTWGLYQGFKKASLMLLPEEIDRIGDARAAAGICRRGLDDEARSRVVAVASEIARARNCPLNYQLVTRVLNGECPPEVRDSRLRAMTEDRDAYKSACEIKDAQIQELGRVVAALRAENTKLKAALRRLS